MQLFHRIFGDKDTAVLDARNLAKKRKKIFLFESPNKRFIVTNSRTFASDQNYREIDYVNVSMTAIRKHDKEFMHEVPLNERGYA